MRRVPFVVAVVVALAATTAGCGGSHDDRVVASVGSTSITREQLDETVDRFGEEAAREGKPFVDDRAVRRHLLGLLVYRARIEQGAAALGITLSHDAVEERLKSAGEADEGEDKGDDAFAESSVRAQLYMEAVYRRLAARIRDTDPQRRQARRNTVLAHWLAALPQRFPVRLPHA
ncbi:MAG TPA: SurA N-terminal domain-containing protein [Gaiellaceae bacterium]|jgi:hypothetical protein